MPRTARASVGGFCYHVLNRGNAQAEVFHTDDDYRSFLKLIRDACERRPMRVIGHCLMPNHFHLVLWPHADGDLSRWMQWLLTAHVRRYHRHYGGSGHVWQGRFKAFPIQKDEHLLTVLRYVERNGLRANLVRRAEDWPWGSLAEWSRGAPESFLHSGPVPRGREWIAWVNRAPSEAEIRATQHCIQRGTPYGSERWVERTVLRLGLESTIRPLGRPGGERK